MTQIAIIGAGIAGLACARKLAQAGVHAVMFDKGRGIGGRVATRRSGDLRFDHGAPYVTATGGDFDTCLSGLIGTGHAAPWVDDKGNAFTVGKPGMSGIAKGLAVGLDVRLGTQITAIHADQAGWRLQYDDTQYVASHVVVTVPQPQVAGILGGAHPLVAKITDINMVPSLTLMAAVSGPVPPVCANGSGDLLALITRDCSKPNRPQNEGSSWVAHAGIEFSMAHLEMDRTDIALLMVPLLCERLDIATDRVTHAVAHRWRYARVSNTLGQPFASIPSGTLYLGGDWCIGPQIEEAWTSGTAIATDMLERGLC